MDGLTVWTMINIDISSMVLHYLNTTAVKPVLTDVAFDHKPVNIIRLPADTV